MLLNCGAGEDSLESLGLQGDPTSPEISSEYSLEGLMLKLKRQYFGHLMLRADSFEKTLMLEVRRRRDDRRLDGWMASPTQWTWVWVGSGSWWWTGRPGVLRFMGSQRVRHDRATELNWTDHVCSIIVFCTCMWKKKSEGAFYENKWPLKKGNTTGPKVEGDTSSWHHFGTSTVTTTVAATTLSKKKVINSHHSHNVLWYLSTEWKCMLVSVDLVGMTTEHFEMSSFPLPESICYFL